MGIEPTPVAWKATALPLSYARTALPAPTGLAADFHQTTYLRKARQYNAMHRAPTRLATPHFGQG